MRKLLYGVLALAAIAMAALLIVPQVLDWNSYKSEIATLVRDATGRDVELGGNIDFKILPSPTLSANEVRIANIPGATAPDILRLKSLGVRVAFWPLLEGRIEFRSIELIEPVIELERLASGRNNWTTSAAPAPRDSRPPRVGAADGRDPESLALDSLRITRGTVVYRDSAAGTLQRLDNLDAQLSAGSLAGPYQIAGTVDVAGITLDLEASVGRLGAADPAPVRVNMVAANAELELKAILDAAGPQPRLAGRLTASGDSLSRVVTALGGGPGPGALAQPFNLSGQLVATEKTVALDQMEISFGGARATGAINTALAPRVRADVVLKVNRIDLNSWIARVAPTPAMPSIPSPDSGPAAGGGGSDGFRIPADVDGSLELTVGRIVAGDGLIRDVRVSARLERGRVSLRRAKLHLPGGSEATLTGALRVANDRPSYSGKLDLQADNLRSTLRWLKVDTKAILAARLRKFSLKGSVSGDDRQVQMTEIVATLDTTRLTGGVNYALRRRPSFGARVEIDRVNLDSYLGVGGGDAAADSGPGAAAPSRRDRQSAPLAVLKEFDANIDLRIGRLRYRRTPIRDLALNGTLFNGKLTVKDASVGDLAGLAAEVKGSLDGFEAFPRFRGTVAAAAGDLGGALRLVGLGDLLPARSLGRFRLSGRADAGRDQVSLETDVRLAGGRASLSGNIEGLSGPLDYDLALEVTHPSGSALLRRLGVKMPEDGEGKPLPLRLAVKAKGSPEAAEVDTTIAMFGGETAWRGTVRGPLQTPKFDLTVTADHPEFTELVRALGAPPPTKKAGKLMLSAKVRGDPAAVRLAGLRTRIGKAEFRGDGGLVMTGPRPALQASLTAGDLDLNQLALPLAGAARGTASGTGPDREKAGAEGASRYSTERFDLSGFAAFDAEIELAARSLAWDAFRVSDPRVDLGLKDRVLTVRRITGRMYEGTFDLNGKINAAGTPSFAGVVNISGANVGKALFRGRDFDIQRGIVAIDLSVGGSGNSELAVVRSLSGSGKLAVRDGLVKGFDLPAVSARLKRLREAKDFLALFSTAMGGGTTKFDRLDGTFRIRKGVLTTKDLTLIADAGKGEAKGTLDLPRWHMDFQSWFRLTEHAGAPPFGMRVQGPPDAPRRSFDSDKLQAFLVRRNVGKFLKKVLPKPEAPAAEPAPPAPMDKKPTEKVRPEDILKGLLEGLKR